jgi:hypothetical protein
MRKKTMKVSNYSVACAQCGAQPWQQCLANDGTKRATVHETRAAEAAATTRPHPLTVICPQCGSDEGEKCRIRSKTIDAEGNWKWAGIGRTKKFYCKPRFWRASGAPWLNMEESAAESGVFAPDFHESATETGLLAEADEPFDWATLTDAEGIDWAIAALSAEARVGAAHSEMARAQ